MQSQKWQNDLCFQGKPFNITVIQVYAPTSNAEEAEAEWFYEDLQDLLELTKKNWPKKDVLFIIEDWNANTGSEVTGKLGLEVQNEAEQRLTEFCQENALVITPTSNNTRDDSTHGHNQMANTKIRLFIFFAAKEEDL